MEIALGFGKKDADLLRPDGFRQSVYALLLATLAINVLSLALPVMTKQIYDRILPNPGTGTLPVLITGVCLAVFFESLLRLARSYVIGRAGAAYEHRMACEAMRKSLNADLSKTGSCGIGEYLHRMSSVGKLKDFYDGHALTVLAELAFVPLFFGLVIYIGQTLALVPAIILLAFVIISLRRGHRMRLALQRREKADDVRFNFLIESLEGIHTIKASALEKFFERRYEALEEESTLENYHVMQETADTFNTGAIFSHLMVAGVISAGAWCVLDGILTTGGLIATLLLSGRMMQPIQKALALWARYQDYLLARRHVIELLSAPQTKTGTAKKEAIPEGRLTFSHVSFRHSHGDKPILKDINLNLQPGETVYISGPHGAGKSTLLNLISGIYPPTGGHIEIDGRNISNFSAEELVQHVGYIRTIPLIFRGTIRDNITCFGQTDEKSIRKIAALLEVDKDIARLPGGFDTPLSGNNTDSIPPGLKQRIAIVRVLAARPRLILFDSADRCLDRNGYSLAYSLLAQLKGKASMILITDDRNIAALADRHYRLEDGKLLENGKNYRPTNIRSYEELPL